MLRTRDTIPRCVHPLPVNNLGCVQKFVVYCQYFKVLQKFFVVYYLENKIFPKFTSIQTLRLKQPLKRTA
jgi:hypothetical protein